MSISHWIKINQELDLTKKVKKENMWLQKDIQSVKQFSKLSLRGKVKLIQTTNTEANMKQESQIYPAVQSTNILLSKSKTNTMVLNQRQLSQLSYLEEKHHLCLRSYLQEIW